MAPPSAQSSLERAIRWLAGEEVPRDLAAARLELGKGAVEGDVRAAHLLAGFLAGGIGGSRDWPGAVALLRQWAGRDALAAKQVELISAMALTPGGDPAATPALKSLHAAKRIAFAEKLLTPEECAFLIQLAGPRLRPATVIAGRDRVDSRPEIRDNDHAAFAMLEEPPFIRAINRRIAAATGTLVEQGEPIQVMRYFKGQQYRTHLDRIGKGTNKRLMTAIVYLNDGYAGGETAFPALKLAVRGRQGDLLLFGNLTDGGEVDLEMRHAGLPPTEGVKFIASRWILQRPAYDGQGNLLGETLWA